MFRVIDDIKDCLIEAFYELSDIFADVVIEPFYLHYQPYCLDRIEIG